MFVQIVVNCADSRIWSTECVIAPIVLVPVTVLPVELFVEARIVDVKFVAAYANDRTSTSFELLISVQVRSNLPYSLCSSAIFQVYCPFCTTS